MGKVISVRKYPRLQVLGDLGRLAMTREVWREGENVYSFRENEKEMRLCKRQPHKTVHFRKDCVGEKRALPGASLKILSKPHKLKLWPSDTRFE